MFRSEKCQQNKFHICKDGFAVTKSNLHYTKARNEWWGPSPRLSARAALQLQRNAQQAVGDTGSNLTGLGIEPKILHTDSDVFNHYAKRSVRVNEQFYEPNLYLARTTSLSAPDIVASSCFDFALANPTRKGPLPPRTYNSGFSKSSFDYQQICPRHDLAVTCADDRFYVTGSIRGWSRSHFTHLPGPSLNLKLASQNPSIIF